MARAVAATQPLATEFLLAIFTTSLVGQALAASSGAPVALFQATRTPTATCVSYMLVALQWDAELYPVSAARRFRAAQAHTTMVQERA